MGIKEFFQRKKKEKLDNTKPYLTFSDTKIKLVSDKHSELKIIDTDCWKDKTPIIQVENVNKIYKMKREKIYADKDINLTFYDKQNIALLGGNGAGKTTLVEIIAGINKQTSGKINYLFDYQNTFQEGIGIQFQESNYPVGLRIIDIINFMVEVYSLNIQEQEIDKVLDTFGLLEFKNKQARSLSGGQKQRLNVLLALIHKPKIVFLDELSTGLDITVRAQVKQLIREFCNENGINICLVSHDMEEVNLLVDRIVILQKGEIKIDMPKEEIIKKFGSIESLVEQFI